MNKVEVAAHDWLARYTGFARNQITFRHNKTPDFKTPDGKEWEVKTLIRGKITVDDMQWFDLLRPRVTIVVFTPNNLEPRYTIPSAQLYFGIPRWEDLTIVTSIVTIPTVDFTWHCNTSREDYMVAVQKHLYPMWQARQDGYWRLIDRHKVVDYYREQIREYARQHPDYAHWEIAKYFYPRYGLCRSRITQILGKNKKEE